MRLWPSGMQIKWVIGEDCRGGIAMQLLLLLLLPHKPLLVHLL
mgnify:CR=1 FL=1